MPHNNEEIRQAYESKHELKRENQVIILMVTYGTNWLSSIKKLSALFKRVKSNHIGDFYCLNCLHSYSEKDQLKKHEKEEIMTTAIQKCLKKMITFWNTTAENKVWIFCLILMLIWSVFLKE